MKTKQYLLGLSLFLAALVPAKAVVYFDLVNTNNPSFTIGNAIFAAERPEGATGTGTFDTFLRLQDGKVAERGYNTSGIPTPFDDYSGQSWTHDLPIYALTAETNMGGRAYALIAIDINEPNDITKRYLSIDAFKVYVSTIPSQTTTNLASLGTLVYDMDAGEDRCILTDANRNSSAGSGQADVNVYINASLFASYGSNYYVYVYTGFGAAGVVNGIDYTQSFEANAGFEELNQDTSLTSITVIPEPSSSILLSAMGVAFLWRRSLKRRNRARI